MKILIRIILGMLAAFMALAVVIGVIAGVWFLRIAWVSGGPTAAEQHLTHHLSTLSQDRDHLLQSFSEAQSRQTVEPAALPASLRVPDIRYALIQADHITLITYTSPDTSSGFRVWKSSMGSGFADQPTAIHFVTRFSYCDDYPESPSNRLE